MGESPTSESRFGDDWQPTPELLAAYFDGECEGRDDLAHLRRRIEAWLAANPGAREELAQYRALRNIWQQTTPVEPAAEKWQRVQRKIEAAVGRGSPPVVGQASRGLPVRRVMLVAAAAGFLLAAFLAAYRPDTTDNKVAEDDTPFPVAAAHEVEVLHIEGPDTFAIVVGELPWRGAMPWAAPGDVTVKSVQPSQRDNMMPRVDVDGPRGPIIWAQSDPDEDQ